MYKKDDLQVSESYIVTFCTKQKQSGGVWTTDRSASKNRLEEFVSFIEQRAIALGKTVQGPQRWKSSDNGIGCIIVVAGAGIALSPNEAVHENFLKGCSHAFSRTSIESITFEKC